jgi:hypothetical protein
MLKGVAVVDGGVDDGKSVPHQREGAWDRVWCCDATDVV